MKGLTSGCHISDPFILVTRLYRLQGTSERLTMHLVEEHSVVDPTFIEDFLLTYRTFLSSPMEVGKKLLEWFNDPSLRDKVGSAFYFSVSMSTIKDKIWNISYVQINLMKHTNIF